MANLNSKKNYGQFMDSIPETERVTEEESEEESKEKVYYD
jgi:hypothetical protein